MLVKKITPDTRADACLNDSFNFANGWCRCAGPVQSVSSQCL